MSIGGAMRTSTSGMNAQANRLSAVSENIANANTTGYKRVTTEFSSLLLPSSEGLYNSGVVTTQTRTLISQQGGLSYTANSSSSQAVDLAISGKGFMIVGDGDGGTFLTRAGSYVKNGEGDLVNAAGYILQGYPLPEGDTNGVSNGFAGLVNVNLNAAQLRLKPTDQGNLVLNLPKTTASLPTYTGTTGAATAGTASQAATFGVTGSGSVAGDKLNMKVKIDGIEYEVDVIATGATGVVGLTIADVAAAINDKVGETVAYNDGTGKLKLLSQTLGTGGIVEMTAATAKQADGTARSGMTIAGLGALATAAGTAEARTGTSNTLPSANHASGNAAYTAKTSMEAYDNTGGKVILDIYMTKTNNHQWEYAVYDRAAAGTGSTAPFPYTKAAISVGQMAFDTVGNLKTPAGGGIDIAIPNGQTMKLDLTGTSEYSGSFQRLSSSVNGNPPESVDKISISADGIVRAEFKSGSSVNLYKIPLALVESPDNMAALPGNVFSAGLESGTVLVGFGTQSGLGSLVSGALEESTVDLAAELTTMIESQRSYTANSKVFQTGSEILDVLVNLKR